MLTVHRVATLEGFAALEQEWDSLLCNSAVDDAFLTWEFLFTWWRHYGAAYELWLLAVYDDGLLVGLAPLMLETQRVLGGALRPLRVLRNISLPTPDVGGVIVRASWAGVVACLAEWLAGRAGEWDVLWLAEMPPEAAPAAEWRGLFDGCVSDSDVSAHYCIRMEGGWPRYDQGLSKNLHNDVNRKIRKLRRQAGFAYIHRRGAQAGVQDMDLIFQINRQARHTYLYRTQAERDFQRDLAQAMAARGMLEVYFLYIDNAPAAFYYGFWRRQTFEFWRTGFDPAFSSFSPGKALLYLLLQDGFAHNMRAMDFLSGDESYKRDWQVETRHYTHLRLVRRSPLPVLIYVLAPRFRRAVRDFLRRHPALHPLLEAVIRLTNRRQNQAGATVAGEHGAG